MFRIFLFTIIIVFLSSCLSVKPGGIKSGSSLFETFYVGEGGTQYFVKPLEFENSEGDAKIIIDFSFRHYEDSRKDTVITNYSLLDDQIIRKVESFKIENTATKSSFRNNSLLFNEKSKEIFKSRFTSHIMLSELKGLFDNEDWKIEIAVAGAKLHYFPSGKSRKIIPELQNELFVLIN